MANTRFRTVGRNDHRHGRVALLMDMDLQKRSLHVNLIQARGLSTGFTTPQNIFIKFRMQLLPMRNSVLVHKVLNLVIMFVFILIYYSHLKVTHRRG